MSNNQPTQFVNQISDLNTEHKFWTIADVAEPKAAITVVTRTPEGLSVDRKSLKSRIKQQAKADASAALAQTLDFDLTVSNEAIAKDGQPIEALRLSDGTIFVPSNPLNGQVEDAIFNLLRTLHPEVEKGTAEQYEARVDELLKRFPISFNIDRFYAVTGKLCVAMNARLVDGDIKIDPEAQQCSVCPHDAATFCYHKLAAYGYLGGRVIMPVWLKDYYGHMKAVYSASLAGDKKQVFMLTLKGILNGVNRADEIAQFKAARDARTVVISLSK